ncbi:MAG: phosphoribosylformylglycinamidine synthase II [Elusimicrobia bacterium RIFOXYC2_FULL_34_12]|nr:MAG: phosphoribosylformylglycinamidine synthase II [Elusimicrobia bacterium RIFOXYC2_FULL_34_12]
MVDIKTIDILSADEAQLQEMSRKYLLSLNLEEMLVVQKYFKDLGKNPTDVEIETIAQTWSEHCKHKTLTSSIDFNYTKIGGKPQKKFYKNLLKDTIFRITKELNKKWCISVFQDNAGVIEFDEKNAVAFKVETHNHPSAIEPYGGAGTGIGGVIRDILGVGLGAKPIMNTDVFCFGPDDYPQKKVPKGVLHPKRVFKGVVSGVRDYGNRMGIPTANGTILFDDGYVFNPLVYCGTVGILPKDKAFKKVLPGDIILAVGGKTGRDGIHGATFSSLSLDENVSSTVVQIGNPIVEKKVLDTMLIARDKNLYNAVTDCGAGGFSSAIGELAIFSNGAKVYLEKAPLKYKGLQPWEIWISEAQERMVFAVPKNNLEEILKIFTDEDVEATVLGEFNNTGKLEVFYDSKIVCSLDMEFLHDGIPKRNKVAVWNEKKSTIKKIKSKNPASRLKGILSSLNVCSKEWVIRQYDHEVQAQTVIKPLVGIKNDGPSDAAVLKPSSDSEKGIVVSNGVNLHGKKDAYSMAVSAIDEALRNVIAVGGNLKKTALLDNFCWGALDTPEQMGEIVMACEACYDMGKIFETPFISGKDSLNNKYKLGSKTLSIPPTLLISAISVIDDIKKCITMDLKKSGNPVYIVGITKDEILPKVDFVNAKKQMSALQEAIEQETVDSCHDCSEGGISVACSEMCFSGGLGMEIDLRDVPVENIKSDETILFSESNSRFIVEVKKEKENEFNKILKGTNFSKIGKVIINKKFIVNGIKKKSVINSDISELKNSWQKTMDNYD